ncbi:Lysophosphatidylcholine acyltransferase 1 [Liparis tanakae]|uniref:Lysophosphatidylcholine acyltransferase 1 n=1 Tax=Liparis tanakae TaxID=230148 RepID=A0A4Z2IRB8_9TELE|nr:Lysophosphatidylcholine acyltransferase 1 [Liparis tanakae]
MCLEETIPGQGPHLGMLVSLWLSNYRQHLPIYRGEKSEGGQKDAEREEPNYFSLFHCQKDLSSLGSGGRWRARRPAAPRWRPQAASLGPLEAQENQNQEFSGQTIAFMTVTLFPIRLLMAAFMMLLAWPFAFLASIGRSETTVEPQCLWRRPVFVSRSDQDSRKKTVEEIKRRAHSGGEWPQGPSFQLYQCSQWFEILWLTLCQLHNEFVVEFLPIYTPSEEEKQNPALFAINVRRVMAKALGVPITDYSFEDCQLAMADGQLRLPVDTCLLEFAKLVRRLGLKPRNTEKVLQDYGNRARKLEGQKLDLDDFAQFLDVPVSEMLRDMFALFDEHEDSCMDIREYVIALSVVCRPAKTLETMKLAFKMFEAEEDGAITEMELAVVLKTALGVSHLSVSHLFTAIDPEDTGKITFDKFRCFAEEQPDFAEAFLYTENAGLHSGPCHAHQTKPSLSYRNMRGTATTKAANGICPDFSPKDHDGTIDGLFKKHN